MPWHNILQCQVYFSLANFPCPLPDEYFRLLTMPSYWLPLWFLCMDFIPFNALRDLILFLHIVHHKGNCNYLFVCLMSEPSAKQQIPWRCTNTCSAHYCIFILTTICLAQCLTFNSDIVTYWTSEEVNQGMDIILFWWISTLLSKWWT